ncbi:jumonji domain-containing protein 1C [Apostasia shenzhenica]|uniref:Jumonji domain-containing protein 1C n=1 Tax=Apostasia shenzhenica TaxID=1088818 RepID=A0A2I0B388_9ASPA|nr:jumonji domain-containing protein 1C [Apostasia shenzhenica]
MSPMNPELEVSGSTSLPYLKKHKEKPKSHGFHSPVRRNGRHVEDTRVRQVYSPPPTKEMNNFIDNGTGQEYSGKSSDSSGGAKGIPCHQCRRNDKANVAWCSSCDRRGYCDGCISRWYAEIPMEEIQKVCPACRGICNCRLCLRGDGLIKAKVEGIAALDKLRYLHSLLAFILPVLKQIYNEQCLEISLEKRIYGVKADIPRVKINVDEQMCCDLCKVPILDYHRHCSQCLYDLCLTCCHDIRSVSLVGDQGEFSSGKRSNGSLMSLDDGGLNYSQLFPNWKVNSDGSIPCGPEDAGGCGFSKLILRRIFKINWTGKLLKNADEMVNGCKGSDLHGPDRCSSSCMAFSPSEDFNVLDLLSCSSRDDISNNFLYHPALEDIKHEGIFRFHKYWVKGQPIIVKNIFDHSLASGWSPVYIWKGIQDTHDEEIKDQIVVKAIDYLNQSEVDVDLFEFIKGYSEGYRDKRGQPKMLKLKDWPPPRALEEFLLCHRPEFLSNFPLVEFFHPKWGLLNLSSKLPHDTLQSEAAPKISISYGTCQKLDCGDPVSNLRINMSDMAVLVMHSAEIIANGHPSPRANRPCQVSMKSDEFSPTGNNAHSSIDLDEFEGEVELQRCFGSGIPSSGRKDSESSLLNGTTITSHKNAAIIWDVYRRQDVPKLNEFLGVHVNKFLNTAMHPIYEQRLYLNSDYKRKLKDEYNVEPWIFQQHVGEAVFIPAGCPFQCRNLQSSVQLAFDFLSPESLEESVRLAKEIRCLPSDHEAKLKMLEVGKISLYAASYAVREIQKIALDPKFSSDIKFEDRELTAMVSENLEKVRKRRLIVCS